MSLITRGFTNNTLVTRGFSARLFDRIVRDIARIISKVIMSVTITSKMDLEED